MSSDYLECTICPKLPTFSDASHLLTHVGSKGHLAHLHRLQVKSHQESEAAQKLSVYNEWFVEHNVAQLLSERMLQKEAKQAKKRVVNQGETSNVKVEKKRKSRKSKGSEQSPVPTTHDEDHPILTLKISESEIADVDFASLQPLRDSSYPTLSSSPPRLLSPLVFEGIDNGDHNIKQDAEIKIGNTSPQLKGTVWPGMGLFDAATLELQRKRNQKKDISVVKRLEALSGSVDPHETIHSALGTVLKRRHMDNLENDSPVAGEIPIELPTPKRQRTSRSKSVKSTKVIKEKRRPGRPRRRRANSPLASPDNLVTSDTEEATKKLSRYSPTEAEDREFKLVIRDARPKKKKGNFLIFEDSSPSFGADGSSERVPSAYADTGTVREPLTYPSTAWSQVQNDLPDPFKPTRARVPMAPFFTELGHGKENFNPFRGNHLHRETGQFTNNPLVLQNNIEPPGTFNPLARHIRPDMLIASRFDPFEDDDAFMPVRNPLATPFGHLTSPDHRSIFGLTSSPVFAQHHRQPLFAP